jgi:uncharacterized protein YndB with AHSA1/START domain
MTKTSRKRWFIRILLVVLVLTPLIGWLASPYKQYDTLPYKAIAAEVEINASPEQVFAYLSHSEKARNWSVFVDHITPLNGDQYADGAVGLQRRCFKQADEQGIIWDEVITVVEPAKRRQLSIYNMVGFSMTAEGLLTEQRYTPLEGGKRCKLMLTLFYQEGKPSFWDAVKTHFVSWRVRSIFVANLANIKREIEPGR